jgi:predicted NAD/FAD-binding protein
MSDMIKMRADYEVKPKTAKLSMNADLETGLMEFEVHGSANDLHAALTAALAHEHEVYEVIREVVLRIEHKLKCNCENCTKFREAFFKEDKTPISPAKPLDLA